MDTIGVQVVNGWNNVTTNNGGVTIGLTNALVKPKYTWNVNYYTGPSNTDTEKGYRNLIDTTLAADAECEVQRLPQLRLRPESRRNYGNRGNRAGDNKLNHWQGVAVAVHEQFTGTSALAGRFEFFNDMNGYSTGLASGSEGIHWDLRVQVGRRAADSHRVSTRLVTSQPYFHKGDTNMVDAQSTVTAGFVAFFGPKR